MHYSSTKQCSSSEMVVVVTKWLPSNTDTVTYTLEQVFVCLLPQLWTWLNQSESRTGTICFIWFHILQAAITLKITILKLLPIVFQKAFFLYKHVYSVFSHCISGLVQCFCLIQGIQNIKDHGQCFSKDFSCNLIRTDVLWDLFALNTHGLFPL